MGKKPSSKSPAATPPPPAEPKRGSGARIATVVALALAVGAFVYFRQSAPAVEQATAAATPAQTAATPVPAADLKPHKQANLPALQFPGYPTPRSPEVVRAAYTFAAEHPEVLSYVPCFCGCERSGHRGNEDCFVRERAVNGDVIAWEDHGMECAVCLDVADRSRQLFAAGKSVAEIRATIEKEWAGRMPSHTPTPAAPGGHDH
ncbi:MAG TPA: PCYCGC motif-containing (lipo)protein [Vicinamibacterales bacterium]|jgi:hypothetical protein|nr:PCYCGC motif-containing (lipo)protein [Vicinamibacterales bacterium]